MTNANATNRQPAAGQKFNQNQTLATERGIKVRTGVKAGNKVHA